MKEIGDIEGLVGMKNRRIEWLMDEGEWYELQVFIDLLRIVI